MIITGNTTNRSWECLKSYFSEPDTQVTLIAIGIFAISLLPYYFASETKLACCFAIAGATAGWSLLIANEMAHNEIERVQNTVRAALVDVQAAPAA